jgi:hypothetical protein
MSADAARREIRVLQTPCIDKHFHRQLQSSSFQVAKKLGEFAGNHRPPTVSVVPPKLNLFNLVIGAVLGDLEKMFQICDF